MSNKPGTPPRRLRDTAFVFVQRRQAVPVSLVPPMLSSFVDCTTQTSSNTTTTPHDSSTHAGTASHDAKNSYTTSWSRGGSIFIPETTSPGDASAKHGLRAQDVLIVGVEASVEFHTSAHSSWCYRTCAAHLLRGGHVTHVFTPASVSFDVRSLIYHVEQHVLVLLPDSTAVRAVATPHTCTPYEHAAYVEDMAQARQRAVMQALARVHVIECHDVNDLYAFCRYYTFPEAACSMTAVHSSGPGVCPAPSTVSLTTPRAAPLLSSSASATVPLIIIHHAAGVDGYLSLYERARGMELPLTHWMFHLLQSRLRCALILTETIPAVLSLSASSFGKPGRYGGSVHFTDSTTQPSSTPSPAHVRQLAQSAIRCSDLVHRIQSSPAYMDKVSPSSNTHGSKSAANHVSIDALCTRSNGKRTSSLSGAGQRHINCGIDRSCTSIVRANADDGMPLPPQAHIVSLANSSVRAGALANDAASSNDVLPQGGSASYSVSARDRFSQISECRLHYLLMSLDTCSTASIARKGTARVETNDTVSGGSAYEVRLQLMRLTFEPVYHPSSSSALSSEPKRFCGSNRRYSDVNSPDGLNTSKRSRVHSTYTCRAVQLCTVNSPSIHFDV